MSVHFSKILHRCRQRSRSSLLTVTLSLGLLAASEPVVAQIVPVCDRTPEVRDEIVSLVSGIDDCTDVTEVHLAAIEGEFFHGGYYSSPDWNNPSRERRPPPPVTALRVGDFSGLSSVTTLYLNLTPLTTLPAGVFTGLSSLETLDLSSTKLTSLPAGAFTGLPSLQELNLSFTKLTGLMAGTFTGLSSLQELNLASASNSSFPNTPLTGLMNLSAGAFTGLSSLKLLRLSHNALTTLPVGAFTGLSSLIHLHLGGNELTSLPAGAFSGLTSIRTLLLNDSALTTLPVGAFAELSTLQLLVLSGNKLVSLPAGAFSGLSSLRTLYLDNNRLTSLPDGIFFGLSSMQIFTMRNNPAHRLLINVFMEWVAPGRFQLRVPTGAPFEIRLRIIVTNGMLRGDSSHVTIPAGRETSDVYSVARQSGTTSPVTVEIAQLPLQLGGSLGYTFIRSAEPLTVLAGLSLEFSQFANGASIRSELVFVNVGATPIQPALYFFDAEGNLIDPASIVDVGEDRLIRADGSLTVRKEIEPLGQLTISTHGRGDLVTGSARAVADGPIGGVLRFDSSDMGVAGVGTGIAVQDAIFPVRRQESGINTGVAIRNRGEDPITVSCQLTQRNNLRGDVDIPLAGHGQTAQFIDELFPETYTGNFVGSVRCMAPEDSLFTGVALEMDFQNRIFTTLPVVPVPPMRTQDNMHLHFPHFANGSSITSDLVLVNVASGPIHPVIQLGIIQLTRYP